MLAPHPPHSLTLVRHPLPALAGRGKRKRSSLQSRAGRIVWRLQARAHGHALARNIDLEPRGEPSLVDARAAGRRVAERHDTADSVAIGRRGYLAHGFAIAQNELAAMPDQRLGRQRDETKKPAR